MEPKIQIVKRSMDNVDMETARHSTPDIKVHGNPGAWVCVSKASSQSQGWMKSTKVMEIKQGNSFAGCLVQVTTEHRDPKTGIVTACAEAVTFLPGAKLEYFDRG